MTPILTHLKYKPQIQLFSGNYFDLLEPAKSNFTIEDIAHALSHICRFTGHCDKFYSVAQHSVLVSFVVPEKFAMEGLLHDAAEAFIGDIASPLKQLLPDYKVIEQRIEHEVFTRLGINPVLPPEVKHADMRALLTEKRDLMKPCNENWAVDGVEGCSWTLVEPWDPIHARFMFLDRYRSLDQKRAIGKLGVA